MPRNRYQRPVHIRTIQVARWFQSLAVTCAAVDTASNLRSPWNT